MSGLQQDLFDTVDRICGEHSPRTLRESAEAGTWPAALNAANEEAVAAFLDGRIAFTAIAESIREVLDAEPPRPVSRLEDVLEADQRARVRASAALARHPAPVAP